MYLEAFLCGIIPLPSFPHIKFLINNVNNKRYVELTFQIMSNKLKFKKVLN